jgi:predicted DNA-binding transcriptional regulator YafY
MRADRLLSILMILQSHGRTTAAKLADELEVTPRTIYRDLDALSTAGVPVFADRGPGGGCSLDEHYRTTLTGLTDEEIQALFAMNIPGPLEQLGIGVELKAALRKLLAGGSYASALLLGFHSMVPGRGTGSIPSDRPTGLTARPPDGSHLLR